MTENKGDLISRDALKKAITEATYNFEQIPIRVDKVQEIIDNAPTVEPCNDCEDRKQAEYIRHSSSWHELQALRKFKEEHDRPQGEWKFKKFDEETGISNSDWCPFCGKAKAQIYDKFCGNCGAQLKR